MGARRSHTAYCDLHSWFCPAAERQGRRVSLGRLFTFWSLSLGGSLPFSFYCFHVCSTAAYSFAEQSDVQFELSEVQSLSQAALLFPVED